MPHRHTPRFLKNGHAILDVTPGTASTEPLKLALALHGLQFVTPWITVADGKGRYLSHLTLLLTASGDALTAVRWETQYVYGQNTGPPDHITMQTTWDHALEHDLSSALTLLFLVAAGILASLVYATCTAHGRSTLGKLLSDDYEREREEDNDSDDAVPSYRRARRGDGYGERRTNQQLRGSRKDD